jgi:hypothetical protein
MAISPGRPALLKLELSATTVADQDFPGCLLSWGMWGIIVIGCCMRRYILSPATYILDK